MLISRKSLDDVSPNINNNSSLDFKVLPTPTPTPTSTLPPTPPPTPTPSPSPSPSPSPTPTPPITPEDPNNPNDPNDPQPPLPPVFPPPPVIDCGRELPKPGAEGYPRFPGMLCLSQPYCCENLNICGNRAKVKVFLQGGDPDELYRIGIFYNGRQYGPTAQIRANEIIEDLSYDIYLDDYFKPSTAIDMRVRVWGGNFAIRPGDRPSEGCSVSELNQDGTIPMYVESPFTLRGYPQGGSLPFIGCAIIACDQCP
jgi:hypothetical protein